jgi:hypothetical protein
MSAVSAPVRITDTRNEEWRHLPDFPGYLVSSYGRVASYLGTEVRQLQPHLDDHGYQRVWLQSPHGKAHPRVHQIVATAFHGPRPEGMECRHLNGNRLDNCAENLRWGTRSENMLDRVEHGTHHHANKTHCRRGHPFDEANTMIRKNGARACRTCQRHFHREYMIRKALRAANVRDLGGAA